MSVKPYYRIGIDVGGTNTDCALLEIGKESTPDRGIVSTHKTLTTAEVTDGISASLKAVLDKSGVEPSRIISLAIGTTHFINAIIEADHRRLAKVAVVRLGAPYTAQCPPFVDFPSRLRNLMDGHQCLIDGGLQIDGQEIRPINPEQVLLECHKIKAKGIKNVVIVGVFSPLAAEGSQEQYVRKIMHEFFGTDVNIVCSNEVGPIGLLERENAAIMNCSMLSFAKRTILGYSRVLSRLKLSCPLYLTRLDGTLVKATDAALYPIRTFANGPTNSMRGAAFLAGLHASASSSSIVVADIGGTSTDIGVLLPSGFPRKAAAYSEVAGVRTNFSMPDIYSIGLGGGSRVRFANGRIKVGPDSTGSDIRSQAIVFGGNTLTATDIAIAAGASLQVENTVIKPPNIPGEQVAQAVAEMSRMLENAIDKMKTDSGDVSVLLVGGGSIIIPPRLRGVKEVLRPTHFSVANAIGAAIGKISGEVDRVVIMEGKNYDEVLESCRREAISKAIAAGADRASTSVMEVATIQLPYVSNQATRVIVKASGDLARDYFPVVLQEDSSEKDLDDLNTDSRPESTSTSELVEKDVEPIDISKYQPTINSYKEWLVNETDLAWIADGCAVLGCGGGGAPYPAYIMVRQILRDGGRVRIVDESYFKDEQASVLPCGFMGSPSVSFERIPAGTEIPTASQALMKFCGIDKVDAVLCDEIGGKNGVEPMRMASSLHFDCPLLDGDLMGRAYPRMNQVATCINSERGLTPAAGADGVGNCVVVPSTVNDGMVENILRSVCTDLGSAIGVAMAPMTIAQFREVGLNRSTSMAWRIGKAIASCRSQSSPFEIPRSILQVQNGEVLFVGKVIDVQREVRGGFTWGKLTLSRLSQDEVEDRLTSGSDSNDDSQLIIPFQNENLSATLIQPDGSTKTLCCVPDLIAVLDSQNGSAIGTQDYRYGLRVTVIGMAGNPKWQTPAGLKLGGPAAFGLEAEYVPIGTYKEVRSVIEEFA